MTPYIVSTPCVLSAFAMIASPLIAAIAGLAFLGGPVAGRHGRAMVHAAATRNMRH